jgi:hypothetical protein
MEAIAWKVEQLQQYACASFRDDRLAVRACIKDSDTICSDSDFSELQMTELN